jgi:hypothetical protein
LLSDARSFKLRHHQRRGTGSVSIQAVLLPLFVQVVLTFVLLFWTGSVRSAAVRRGDVHPREIALREPNGLELG